MNIGIIGYGGVGKALVRLIKKKKFDFNIKFIIKSDGGIVCKSGIDIDSILINEDNLQRHELWSKGLSLENVIDNDIDYLIELTPTNKDTGEPALSFIKLALKNGISVVTGNKGPVLIDYKGLKRLAEENNAKLGIGCTVGAALPTIEGGAVGCAGADILCIEGILNGTSNFILSEMSEKAVSYEEALHKAQSIGIAETNPYMDVEGYDTAIKMIILTNYFFDSQITLKDVDIVGISNISKEVINRVKDSGGKIKLLGKTYRENNEIKIKVSPEILNVEHSLYSVDRKNKGILFNTDVLGNITIIGGASGVENAAASIVRDITNLK